MSELLRTLALRKAFGGLEAVRGVDFSLEAGEIRGLIGPNGAGKTTLVSMISGRIPPASGRVLFKGRDITRLSAWARVGLGIAYTFQVTSIFRNLRVGENVALAVQRRLMRRPLDRVVLKERVLAGPIRAALAAVGLEAAAHQRAGSLPYGHQKLLEVAMALALEPEVLILDEPTQGLAPEEIGRFCGLVREISSRVTILLIEHNLAVVLELASRISVMDKGAIIAEGPPAEIERDADVQRAYLGR